MGEMQNGGGSREIRQQVTAVILMRNVGALDLGGSQGGAKR